MDERLPMNPEERTHHAPFDSKADSLLSDDELRILKKRYEAFDADAVARTAVTQISGDEVVHTAYLPDSKNALDHVVYGVVCDVMVLRQSASCASTVLARSPTISRQRRLYALMRECRYRRTRGDRGVFAYTGLSL